MERGERKQGDIVREQQTRQARTEWQKEREPLEKRDSESPECLKSVLMPWPVSKRKRDRGKKENVILF